MISGEESLWVALKFQGFFEDYDTFEEYKNRNKKVKTVAQAVEENQIKKNIKKSEELEFLIASYNPKPRNPIELKKFEGERMEKEDKEWRLKHLLTDEHRERFDSWG